MAISLLAEPLYALADNSCWPSLTRQQLLPSTLQSRQATSSKRPTVVGLGLVKAICASLTQGWLEMLAFDPVTQRWTARVRSASTPGTHHVIGGDRTTWWADHPGYLYGLVWLIDALTVARQSASSQEFRDRWVSFLQLLTREVGTPPPYSADALRRVAQSDASGRLSSATLGMMAVMDALYYSAKARASGPDLTAALDQPDPAPLAGEPDGLARWLYLLSSGAHGQSSDQSSGQSSGQSSQPAWSAGGVWTPMPLLPHRNAKANTAPGASETHTTRTTETPSTAAWRLDSVALPPGVDPFSGLGILCRVVQRGGTALLVGPTGGGKSSVARAAARLMGADLVLLKGYPSMTDRDLFGKVTQIVTPEGQTRFAWVDGPLSQAFRAVAVSSGAPGSTASTAAEVFVQAPEQASADTSADNDHTIAAQRAQHPQQRRVTLVIDELARLDPLYLAPLLGALDQQQGDDLMRLVGVDAPTRAALLPDEWYRLLSLPTGETLIAPVTCLSVIATANLGFEYQQAHQEFDAALLGRFTLHLDIERLDQLTRVRLLKESTPAPLAVAQLLAAAEDFTCGQTGATGGLLRRTLNLRVCLSWAQEAVARRQAGAPWEEALTQAANLTAIPFCCARDSGGALDRPAAEAFRDWLRQTLPLARLPH